MALAFTAWPPRFACSRSAARLLSSSGMIPATSRRKHAPFGARTTGTCGGSPIDTLTRKQISTEYGITATACSGSSCSPGSSLDYVYDPRGIPYTQSPATYVVTRNAAADTVNVGQFGRVTR